MPPLRVLVIEDHHDIAANICDYLEAQGYVTDYAADGMVGLHLAGTNQYDVIVLDVMLPGIDGLAVCQRLRESDIVQPAILMLTARDALKDKLSGFDVGADDYLVKPFAMEELHARLKAVCSRNRKGCTPSLEVGPLSMDTGTMTVTRDKTPVKLNRIAFNILKELMQAHPNIIPRKELEFAVWGDEPPGSDALRSHIYTLRNKIDKDFPFPMLQTVHGFGFKLTDSDEH